MKRGRSIDLTSGPILKKLILFTLPILASNLLQHLYGAADKAVVGNFATNGKLALAAVGSTTSATNLMLNLFIGLAVGANIVCSNLRGGKRFTELRKCMHSCLLLAAIGGVCISLLGLVACRPLLQLMNCPSDIIDLATLYMRIIFCGTPFSMVYNFSSAILRSHGDTRRPMMILSVSGLVNVGLNLVFVLVFRMGVAGVALATIISQMISCVRILRILFNPKDDFKLRFAELKLHAQEVKSILRVGIPCGINTSVFSLSNATVQAAMNTFSSTAIAGNVAAGSITSLSYQILTAFYSGCVSFAGQCYGAQKYKRINKLVGCSLVAALSLAALVALVATLFPTPMLSIFNQDPAVLEYGKFILILISWSYLVYGTSEIFLGCLRGMKRSGIPTLINVLGVCVFRVLWVALAFPFYHSIPWLFVCYPISYICSATGLGLYYRHTMKKLEKAKAELPSAT